MKLSKLIFFLFLGFVHLSANASGLYTFKINHAEEGVIDFSQYKGKVILLSNIATRCGFTEQLDDLEKLHSKYQDKNFVVIGIPSNNFLSQTPEENKEVVQFCKLKYKTNFPISEKVDVIGSGKHPLIKWVHEQKGYGSPILWNFEKFLIDRNGNIVERFRSMTKPLDNDVVKAIEKELAK